MAGWLAGWMAGQNLAELSFERWLAGWLASENLAELNFGQFISSAKSVVSFLPVIVKKQPAFANAAFLCYLNCKGLQFEF